jgi:hypothetical protein
MPLNASMAEQMTGSVRFDVDRKSLIFHEREISDKLITTHKRYSTKFLILRPWVRIPPGALEIARLIITYNHYTGRVVILGERGKFVASAE